MHYLLLPDDLINYINRFNTKVELIMLSHINKQFNKCAVKCKNIKFKLLQYIETQNLMLINAASEGYLNIIIYYDQIICDMYKIDLYDMSKYATINGQIEILNWIKNTYNEYFNTKLRIWWNHCWCKNARDNNHLEVIEWIIYNCLSGCHYCKYYYPEYNKNYIWSKKGHIRSNIMGKRGNFKERTEIIIT